jgi:cytochrome c-type biogenesis protein CcmH/NrfG
VAIYNFSSTDWAIMSTFAILSTLLVALAGSFLLPTLWRHSLDGAPSALPPQRTTAVVLLLALTLMSVTLYGLIGEPRGLNPPETPVVASSGPEASTPTHGPTPEQIEGMVSRLAQRLQAQPNDPDGWRKLARSYETLGRFDQAVLAYQRLLALVQPDADVLTDYAVTLGMSRGQTLVGEPEALIQAALKLNPSHVQALALAGEAAFDRGDVQLALARWSRLLTLLPVEAPMRQVTERNISKAKALANAGSKPLP